MAVSNTQPWQSEGCAFCRPVGTTLCSVSDPRLPSSVSSSDGWSSLCDPLSQNFSILARLGRAPKCHFSAWRNANLLPRRLIEREIISVCRAGGSPHACSACRSSSDQRWAIQTAETPLCFTVMLRWCQSYFDLLFESQWQHGTTSL